MLILHYLFPLFCIFILGIFIIPMGWMAIEALWNKFKELEIGEAYFRILELWERLLIKVFKPKDY